MSSPKETRNLGVMSKAAAEPRKRALFLWTLLLKQELMIQ